MNKLRITQYTDLDTRIGTLIGCDGESPAVWITVGGVEICLEDSTSARRLRAAASCAADKLVEAECRLEREARESSRDEDDTEVSPSHWGPLGRPTDIS